ncbi:MAG: chromate efflux transporter [Anaerolineae bacterium]
MSDSPTPIVSYRTLALFFLRFSLQAFGGPVAHISMAEDELVTRRKWLTREHYLDLVAATNLIPGPNSTEVMIHVGFILRGIPGAVLAGACFITPAALLSLALALIYITYGTLPQIEAALWGIQPVIVAIILVAAYRLARSALRTGPMWVLGAVSLLLIVVTPVPELFILLGAGVAYALFVRLRTAPTALFLIGGALPALVHAVDTTSAAVTPTMGGLFAFFFGVGATLFGSGYLLVTYLENGLVRQLGWLTQDQLLAAITIGQFTPGPVLTTATVTGTMILGIPGAIVATIAIFLPAFVLVIVTAPLIPRMRRNRTMGAFLDGINAAVIAAILVTVVRLAGTAFAPLTPTAPLMIGPFSGIALLLGLLSLVALIRYRLNATFLLLLGAGVGLLAGALT